MNKNIVYLPVGYIFLLFLDYNKTKYDLYIVIKKHNILITEVGGKLYDMMVSALDYNNILII